MKFTDPTVMAFDTAPSAHFPLALRSQLASFFAIMWSSIAFAGTAIWLLYGETAFFGVLAALGILMTGFTLHRAICAASRHNAPVTLDRSARDSWRA